MSDAVQEAIAKARAGGKKASAKDAAPAAPAPLVTAASALPAHEIEVLSPVDAIGAASEQVKSDIIEAVEAASPARDTPVEAAADVVVTHVALVKDTTHGEVLHDVVKLEAPHESEVFTDTVGEQWAREEAATAPAGDVHSAFASLPPAGLDVPVFKG